MALGARGWRVRLATDRRAEGYGRDFPAEAIDVIAAATPSGSPATMARAAVRVGQGLWQSRRLIAHARPEAAIGFGGYPTVPPMLAAAWSRVPTVIHEANAVLGRANRFLAPRVSRIAVSVPGVAVPPGLARRVVETGNPVRPAAREAGKIAYPARTATEPFRLLAFGGSQGARVLSDLVPAAIARLPDDVRARLIVVQQCRAEDLERTRAAYGAMGLAAELAPFFPDLPRRIAESHLVVCRSGASTTAELAVIGRPAIMVPLPVALDQDQKANALVLAEAGGGWMIEQADLTPERLATEVAAFVADPARLAAAAAAAGALGRPDAVERLADLVEAVALKQTNGAAAGALA